MSSNILHPYKILCRNYRFRFQHFCQQNSASCFFVFEKLFLFYRQASSLCSWRNSSSFEKDKKTSTLLCCLFTSIYFLFHCQKMKGYHIPTHLLVLWIDALLFCAKSSRLIDLRYSFSEYRQPLLPPPSSQFPFLSNSSQSIFLAVRYFFFRWKEFSHYLFWLFGHSP